MLLLPILADSSIISGHGWVTPTLFQSIVAYSFTFTLIAMVVGTVYAFLQMSEVSPGHKSSLVISGCITLAASMSYAAMRLTYTPGVSFPIEFRYADWTISTPLLLLKFVSMLEYKHVRRSSVTVMLLADVAMIVTGYIGMAALQLAPAQQTPLVTWVMFAVSMLCWFVVIGVLLGPVRSAVPMVQPEVGKGLKWMLIFPTLLWSPYPIAYVIRAAWGKEGFPSDLAQLIENVADLVNKVIFGVISIVAVRAATLATDRRAARAKASGRPAFAVGNAGIDEADPDDARLPAATRKAMQDADAAHGVEAEIERSVLHV